MRSRSWPAQYSARLFRVSQTSSGTSDLWITRPLWEIAQPCDARPEMTHPCRIGVGDHLGARLGIRLEVHLETRLRLRLETRLEVLLETRLEIHLETRLETRVEIRLEICPEVRLEISHEVRVEIRLENCTDDSH